ncbi:DUF6414 family protein [Haloarcula sp. H-GB5]
MDDLSDIPQILYIDKSQVENLYSMLNYGKVTEIVERNRELDSSTKGVGIKKILQLQGSTSSENEDEQEFKKSMNLVGQFATIYSLLTDSESINYIGEVGPSSRQDLDEGDYVEAKGKVRSSPMNEIQERLQQAMPFLQMMQDVGHEDAKELSELDIEGASEDVGFGFLQSFVQELSPSNPLYRLNVEGEEASLVFNLSKEEFQEEPTDFPGEYTEYRVLGRVEHVYSEAEEEFVIDVLDMIDASDREARAERKRALKQITNGASEAAGRDVSESEFKFSYPDIRIRPIAVYLF